MSVPRYMGHEHVALMNAILDGALLDACASFDDDLHVQYDVAGDPEGIRSWTLTVGPSGMSFALDRDVADPVARVSTTYAVMAAAAAAGRAGRPAPEDAVTTWEISDADGLERVSAVLELGRPLATVDVTY